MTNATKPFIRISLAIVLMCLILWPATSAKPKPTVPLSICEKGKSLNIVAHQDDDLLFLNPDIQNDISAGKCVTTVFVTIGDYGHNQGLRFAENRENGSKAAYAEMAGLSDRWRLAAQTVLGHRLLTYELIGNPKIKLVFMRLPNSNALARGWPYYDYQSIVLLYIHKISQLQAVDNSATYSLDDLLATLTKLSETFKPNVIRTQDFTHTFYSGDHADHIAVALMVKKINKRLNFTHNLISYAQYRISQKPENLNSQERLKKEKAWLAYVPYDPDVCQTLSACNYPRNPYYSYYRWLGREYQAQVVKTVVPPKARKPQHSLSYNY